MRVMWFGVLCLGLLSSVSLSVSAKKESSVKECQREFVSWMKQQSTKYDAAELFKRFQLFCDNLDEINDFNANGNGHFKKSLNQFSAYTADEFNSMLGYKPSQDSLQSIQSTLSEKEILAFPEWQGVTLNWTASGAVGPVKNQGSCGSCWSFSTTGAVEGAWQISRGALLSLSEQQLIDCSKVGNYGCQGGSMTTAFSWIRSNGGITSQANNPYVSGTGTNPHTTCVNYTSVATITTYTNIQRTESALLTALAKGPVSVAIQADQSCFQSYRSGVLSEASCLCGQSLNHGVLLVGAGTDAATGLDYWLIKNSWGNRWGDNGYVKLQRGGSRLTTGGQCGILLSNSQPVV